MLMWIWYPGAVLISGAERVQMSHNALERFVHAT